MNEKRREMPSLGYEQPLSYHQFLEFCQNWEAENQEVDRKLTEGLIEKGESFSEVEDKELFERFRQVVPKAPLTYKFHQASNEQEQQERFLLAVRKGEIYEPEFSYGNTETPSLEESARILADLKKFREDIGRKTPLCRLYTRLSIETSRMVILAALSQSEGFALASKKSYKTINGEEREQLEKEISSFYEQKVDFDQPRVNAEEMKRLLEEIYSNTGLRTKVRIRPVEKMTAKSSSSSIWTSIREDFDIPLSEAIKIAAHEPGHALTQSRAKTHPCQAGARKTPGSLQVEEGINIALEKELFGEVRSSLGLPQEFRSERDIIPQIRAFAISLAEDNSFYETFIALRKLGLEDDFAWTVTLRVKRGMPDVSKPGANHKDISYYLGFKQIKGEMSEQDRLEDRMQTLEDFCQGRFSIGEAKYLKRMGIANQNLPVSNHYPIILSSVRNFITEKIHE